MEDGIIDINSFSGLLAEKIKVAGVSGVPGVSSQVVRETMEGFCHLWQRYGTEAAFATLEKCLNPKGWMRPDFAKAAIEAKILPNINAVQAIQFSVVPAFVSGDSPHTMAFKWPEALK